MAVPSRLGFCFFLMLVVSCGGGASNNDVGNGSGSGGGGGGGGGANAVQIQHVEPSRVVTGVAIGAVTLAGTNFTASSVVLFDAIAVSATFGNATLQFQPPETTWTVAQSHTVQVSDPANGKSNLATFEVYSPKPGPELFVGQPTQFMSESLLVNSLVPDINGDGRADLVMVTLPPNSSQAVPVVRNGQADGTFSGPSSLGTFSLPFSPGIVLAGDFNGDGSNDLIFLADSIISEGSYQVVLNDRTGHFTAAGTGTLPGGSASVAVVGDFNHDGKLDFAFGGASNGQAFSLFFGNGDGTFSAPVAAGVSGGNTYQAIATDLNNDGYTDLVYMETFYNAPSQLRVLLSTGNGNYTDILPPQLPSPSLGFVVADFNHDHIPDIFAVNGNGFGQTYLGLGDGTFQPTGNPIFACDGYLAATPFVVGDFDNDGNIDVATRTTLAGPDEMLFLWGDGKGNFTSQVEVSDHSFTLQVGDVNGDGIEDIFAGATLGFAYPSVVLGRRDRNFPSAQILLPNTWGPLSGGDVFHDGFSDLLVAGANDNIGYPGTGIPGTLYHFQTNGTFASVGEAPGYSTLLVDLDGDGIADMVGFTGTTLLIWKGDGSGSFQSPINQIQWDRGFQPIYFRDMDGDGHMDIVLPGAILYGEGNFQFVTVQIPFYENFLVGDFDGDGIPDIATGSGIMFGEGNRTFTAPMGSSPLPDSAPAFPTEVVADINGDGKDDLVIGESGPAIFISVGRQGFVLDQVLMLNGYYPSVTSVTVADFNGDGLLDIATGNLVAGDDLVLFTNDGTGKYEVTSYAIGLNSVYSITGDFNHDGKPDLAFLTYNLTFKPTAVTVLLHR
jgi:hypothetical protein